MMRALSLTLEWYQAATRDLGRAHGVDINSTPAGWLEARYLAGRVCVTPRSRPTFDAMTLTFGFFQIQHLSSSTARSERPRTARC